VSSPIEFLDVEDLLYLAGLLVGDPPPVRDLGLLEAAAARPASSAFGVDAYPDIWTKAAALLQSVVKNHALVDGNKRLAWLATAVFLELNDVVASQADNDDVYELVIFAASTDAEVDVIADRLRRIVSPAHK
jgi:death-on-curing protein